MKPVRRNLSMVDHPTHLQPDHPPYAGILTLVACCLITFVLGSIHAYSVLLTTLERQYSITRDEASLGYSVGLSCLTLAVLWGHRFYAWTRPEYLCALICGVAALGAHLAGRADGLVTFILGYGVLFGTANGLGYGFCLQLGARNLPKRSGLAMGLVTAAYAAGATVFPSIFAFALARGGMPSAMNALLGALVVCAALAGLVLRISKAEYAIAQSKQATTAVSTSGALQLAMWIGYGSAAGAGLMVIAHAQPIFVWMGESGSQALLATTLFAFGNLVGGTAAGWLCDRLDVRKLLIALPLVSAIAFISFQMVLPLAFSLLAMAVVGFSYGALIVGYPAAVIRWFGPSDSPRIYGRIFTAWGAAGLFGPWLAGLLYEKSGGYAETLWVAAVLGAISAAVVALQMPAMPPPGRD